MQTYCRERAPLARVNGATKLKIYSYIDIGKYLRAFQNFHARLPPGRAGPPNVNLGPPNIPRSTRARMLKLKKTIRHCEILALGKKISPLGAYRGHMAR